MPGPPPQAGKVMIGISKNPGRVKQILPMVGFLPTAEMWLGPHFWQYAKCTRDEAIAVHFWLEIRDTPQYSYFKCCPFPFRSPARMAGKAGCSSGCGNSFFTKTVGGHPAPAPSAGNLCMDHRNSCRLRTTLGWSRDVFFKRGDPHTLKQEQSGKW